jgi:Arc/MetJ family transcription regulator
MAVGRSDSDWLKLHVMCMISDIHVYEDSTMRTNIVIDDDLMEEALKATGVGTKKEAVEMGLKTLIRLKKQERIRKFRGKLSWEGDLSEQRTTR